MIARTKIFLPKDLEINKAMPTIYYHALGDDGEAMLNNRIFISISASSESSILRLASLEAHELHHNLRPNLSYKVEIEENDKVVYAALQLALNEGLADMVDKDLLLADTSIWRKKAYIQPIYLKDGKRVVRKLNEYLAAAAKGEMQDWKLYESLYAGFRGHIPGYFMAKSIKDNGRLSEIIEHADNPFVFFLTYQEVALTDKNLPVFNEAVIDYLKKLKEKYED